LRKIGQQPSSLLKNPAPQSKFWALAVRTTAASRRSPNTLFMVVAVMVVVEREEL
jgi:hypothetical protein